MSLLKISVIAGDGIGQAVTPEGWRTPDLGGRTRTTAGRGDGPGAGAGLRFKSPS